MRAEPTEEATRASPGGRRRRPSASVTASSLAQINFSGDEVLVELAVEIDRLRHVARINVVSAIDLPRDLPGGEERGHDLWVDALIVDLILRIQRIAGLGEHPGDEVVKLVESFGGRVFEVGLELLPFRFPLVPVEAGFAHTGCILPFRAPSNHPPPVLDSGS